MKLYLSSILLLMLLAIEFLPTVSASLALTIDKKYVITIEPVVVNHNGYSIIKYCVSSNVFQRFIPGYYSVAVIGVVLLDPINYILDNISIKLGDETIVSLNNSLWRTPLPISLGGAKEERYLIINKRFVLNNIVWRGVSYHILYVKPFNIVDDKHVIIYKKIEMCVRHVYRLNSKWFDHRVLGYLDTISINKVYTNSIPSEEKPVILIITRPLFLNALKNYISIRSKQGYNVLVSTVEEIINTTDGRDIPEKIRNYIYKEYMTYGSRLKYILLVGDVSGAKGYPNGPYNLSDLEEWEVPTRYFYNPDGTDYYSLTGNYTPGDWYYVTMDTNWDSDNNGIYGDENDTVDWAPDIAIGRLPFRTVEELENYINVLENYRRTSIKYWLLTGSTLWFYGEDDGSKYYGGQGDTRSEGLWLSLHNNSLLKNTIPIRLYEHYPATKIIDKPSDQNGNLTLENMINTINTYSPDIITWFAHGSVDGAWRKIWVNDTNGDGNADGDEINWMEFIDTYTLYSNTSSNRSGLVIAMSCLTNYYDYPWGYDSLGETFIKTHSIWYVGWDRVTWSSYYSLDEELDPSTWMLADRFTYSFLYSLLDDSSQYRLDIGYSMVYGLVQLGIHEFMDSQASRKVWWAVTLLGDPSQRLVNKTLKPEAALNIYPKQGHPGSIVKVKGQGFTPNTYVDIYIDNATYLARIKCSSNGSFTTYLQLPLNLKPGKHIINASDQEGVIALTEFTATMPQIYLELYNRSNTTYIYLYVYNLTPNELYYVLIDNSTILRTPYVSDKYGNMVLILWSIGDSFNTSNGGVAEDYVKEPLLMPGRHSVSIVYYPWYYVRKNVYGEYSLPLVVVSKYVELPSSIVTENEFFKKYRELNILINNTRDMLRKYIDEEINVLLDKVRELNESLLKNIDNVNESLKNYISRELKDIRDQINDLVNLINEKIISNTTELNTTLYRYVMEKIDELSNKLLSLQNELTRYNNMNRNNITGINEELKRLGDNLESYRRSSEIYSVSAVLIALIAIILSISLRFKK